MIIVGIDVASQKHDYFMIRPDTGETFSKTSVTIGNSEKGYKKLHEDITAFCGATGDYDVRIGLESTGIYHTNIIMFLLSQSYLFDFEKQLYIFRENRLILLSLCFLDCLGGLFCVAFFPSQKNIYFFQFSLDLIIVGS